MAHPQTTLEKGFVGLMGSALFVVFLSPLLALALRSITRLEADPAGGGGFQTAWTGAYYRELFINRRGSLFYVPPVEAMRNSLVYAGVAVLITLVLGSADRCSHGTAQDPGSPDRGSCSRCRWGHGRYPWGWACCYFPAGCPEERC